MAETITLVSAFDRKRTLGGAHLTEGQREKGRQQKNCVDRRYLFFACSKPLLGGRGTRLCGFPDRPGGRKYFVFSKCWVVPGGQAPERRSRRQRRSSVGVHDGSASSKALASLRSRVSKPSVNQS